MLKGYKVFNSDWTCRGFQYEVGETYEENVNPSLCDRGFHFCKEAKDCFNYYSFNPKNKVAEVVAHGALVEDDDKCCTNKLEIVREIPWNELLTIVNLGKANSGLCNTGDLNTGHRNTGHRNTGNYNTGHRNTGNRNTGHRNTGNWNQGNFCTGDFNISDRATGCFCTEEHHKIKIFDVESNMTFGEWRNSSAYQLLARIDSRTDVAFLSWWNTLTDNEKEIIKSIPNFNADKFLEITGIDSRIII